MEIRLSWESKLLQSIELADAPPPLMAFPALAQGQRLFYGSVQALEDNDFTVALKYLIDAGKAAEVADKVGSRTLPTLSLSAHHHILCIPLRGVLLMLRTCVTTQRCVICAANVACLWQLARAYGTHEEWESEELQADISDLCRDICKQQSICDSSKVSSFNAAATALEVESKRYRQR